MAGQFFFEISYHWEFSPCISCSLQIRISILVYCLLTALVSRSQMHRRAQQTKQTGIIPAMGRLKTAGGVAANRTGQWFAWSRIVLCVLGSLID